MPLQTDYPCENKLTSEKIDFDFYDSIFETDETCDEESNHGVKKVQIKQIVEKPSSSDVSAENDSESKDVFIDSNCDLKDNLNKCLAYENETFEESYASGLSDEDVSPLLGSSLSASTPSSDLTNVTSLTSSSSYSSLNKEKLDDDSCLLNDEEESSKGNLKLLAKAVETLSLQNKPKRSAIPVSTTRQLTSRSRRKNMTFTNEELRKIDRENEILLKKIMSYSKPRSKTTVLLNNTTSQRSIKASSAVNRSKKQREINHDNYILLKKIRNVKASQSYYNNRTQS